MNIVHFERWCFLNTIITSREAILDVSREIVAKHGIGAVNMRSVANACNVSVGSIYNYFPSKADLLSAAVEDIWRDIFHLSNSPFKFEHFTDCLLWLFESVKEGCIRYPEFFTLHSMNFEAGDKEAGRKMMDKYLAHIKEGLLNVLEHDTMLRSDAFNDYLSPDCFIEFIFTIITAMLMRREYDCKPLLEIVTRCIY